MAEQVIYTEEGFMCTSKECVFCCFWMKCSIKFIWSNVSFKPYFPTDIQYLNDQFIDVSGALSFPTVTIIFNFSFAFVNFALYI